MLKFTISAICFWLLCIFVIYMIERDLRQLAIEMQESRPYAVIGE